MSNPFDSIESKLDEILKELKSIKQPDTIGGIELAEEITGLSKSTIYKRTMRREMPHSRVGGRLYFNRSELEAWINSGKREMNKNK